MEKRMMIARLVLAGILPSTAVTAIATTPVPEKLKYACADSMSMRDREWVVEVFETPLDPPNYVVRVYEFKVGGKGLEKNLVAAYMATFAYVRSHQWDRRFSGVSHFSDSDGRLHLDIQDDTMNGTISVTLDDGREIQETMACAKFEENEGE